MSWIELFIRTVSTFYICPCIVSIYFHTTKVNSSQCSSLCNFSKGSNLGNLYIHSDSFLFKSITDIWMDWWEVFNIERATQWLLLTVREWTRRLFRRQLVSQFWSLDKWRVHHFVKVSLEVTSITGNGICIFQYNQTCGYIGCYFLNLYSVYPAYQ